MNSDQILALCGVIALMWAWNMLLTLAVMRHADLFAAARRRIALGQPPFRPSPDDGRDRQYRNRKGID